MKVVLGYKKLSKTAENVDSQRKIVELYNDMSDVFLAFLEMKCDTPTAIYTTMVSWWTAVRSSLTALFVDSIKTIRRVQPACGVLEG